MYSVVRGERLRGRGGGRGERAKREEEEEEEAGEGREGGRDGGRQRTDSFGGVHLFRKSTVCL